MTDMEHSFNKVIDLLFLAREEGVELVMNDERLQLKVGVNKTVDETLLKEIRNNKQLIIDYLKSDNWQATRVTKNNHHKITRFDRDSIAHIPLSFSQERLWFIDHLEGSVQYHSPAVMRLGGTLNKEALVYALRTIIRRQDALRTVFQEIDGNVYQSLKTNEDWELQLVDGSAYKEDVDALKLYIEKLVKEPFDLANDYPIRGSLIRLDDQEHILVATMHHIASDAWSVSIIVKEVAELYSSFIQGRKANLEPLPVQYADFALWQRNYLQGTILEKKISYWKNKLEGQEPLQLPTDYTRPPVRSTRGASTGFKIDKELASQLHELSRQQGVSLFMLLLAAFKVLLQRYSSQEDISVGTSIASRQQKEVEGLVGFFVNTLALRTEFSSDITFTALLEKVKSTTLEAYEHQEIPFDKVVEVAISERDPSRSPLFQVMLVLQNTPESSKLKLGEMVLSAEPFVTNVAKFDITLFITETPNGFMGSVDYNTDLYQAATMKRMTDHFTTLLSSVVADPQQKVGLLAMLSNEEERQLVEQFNSAEVAYPKDKTFVELFEEQVAKTPGNVALVFEKEELSYRELNERSNQLAHYLKSKGMKPNSLVPLYMERSASMIIGLLGIMKAGAAYVPVDTDFPADRISYMLQDAGAAIIVSSKAAGRSLEVEADVEIIEIEDPVLELYPSGNLPVKPLASHLAYVIYTSGSTGRPKGVMIEHCSLVDYYYGLNKYTQIDRCSSFALVSTIATDLGNTVIYASLLSGGALHVFTKESVSNIEYLHRYFREKQIECVKIVPSHWKALSTTEELLLPSKLLVFGGETLQAENVAAIRLSGSLCQVVNHYGPTETTVGKLLHLVQPGGNYEKRIPVGKPFSNTQVYVLSRNMQLCPIGVPGKLYIAGDGVARGYFNNRELTEEKFILNPFRLAGHGGTKMYATGDLVKWLPDGNIEFIGRVDNQVQIRGYRVEPGEVENVLEQCEQVKQGVVLAKLDRQGNNRLVAYVVANHVFDREEIVDYLKKKLPEYMIPAVLMEVDRIPLTANGKINRKALPDPDVAEITGDKYVAPRNETEEKLAGIWAEVLEVDQVGVHDDFFELGGHSLLAVRLISAMRKAFNVEMPIGDIFDYPTVAMLSARVPGKGDTVALPSIEPVHPRPEYIPLSFSQERLWFIDRLDGSHQYHVPAVLRLIGKLNRAALAAALQNVVNRHEVLRTVILEQEGRPYQLITGKDLWQLSVVDGSAYRDSREGLQNYVQELVLAPFDLSKDHMLRGHLIVINEEEHVLVVTLHHIASDGWSRSILVKEVVEGYSAYENGKPVNLPELPVQYADYAIWQRNRIQGEILDKKLGYWKEKLQDLTPLHLPTDYNRPKVQSARGASTSFAIEEILLQQLHDLSTQQGVTLFMTLLAAFKVLLHRYSGQEDICIGTPIAGRQQQELEGLIGFFVNTLALRSEVSGDTLFTDFLQQVKASTLEAYEHQEIPFEKVVDSVVLERDLSRNPLFQVMLILRNTPDVPELNLGDVRLAREPRKYSTTLFDLSLFLTETPHGLHCLFEYSTDLYNEVTINRISGHFKQLLHSIVTTPRQKISGLSLLSGEEKYQLLSEFNDTRVVYPENKTIIDLFEEQALNTPEAIAVIFEKEQLTYQELNERSNQLAHYLKNKGVTAESLVPVCIERSHQMLVGILGILKAGGAYVPIDPEYPEERIRFMLEDTKGSLVVSSSYAKSKISGAAGLEVIELDTLWPLINEQPITILQTEIEPHHLAYVIYTSGSTGKPKGVMIEHGNVYSFICWCRQEFSSSRFDVVYAGTSICFDLSVFELFYPLSAGKRIRVIENGLYISKYLPDDRNVLINSVPSVVQHLLNEGTDLRNISVMNMAGEPIPLPVQRGLDAAKMEIRNLYGPTEDTTYSTIYRLQNGEPVLIGRPISNTQIYIVDKEMELVPVGVAGEICIGGAGVARGYLNLSELTGEKFIRKSFNGQPETRLYRTADLGRWLADGNIEYLGRLDDQVKLRGYRIELGEIETVMQQSEMVGKAVVLARKEGSNIKSLIGYYVPEWKAVKEKELELYERQVENWKEIYETEYTLGEGESADEEFDIEIWKDSFTGQPIGAGQMQEWLQDITAVILSERAGTVLEIGCGTGLIYYQLAGKVAKYIGTDFSKSSINQITKRIQRGLKDYGPTELQVCAAHEVSLPADEQVNTIIMNSIVQYFPGEQYMDEVIGKCIAMLKGCGRLIIGDVRDNRLLKLFKGRLQLQHMGPSVNIREFNWAVDQEVLKEEELLFSPEYFYRLLSVYPQIAHVEIKWKEGDSINELTLYRYTVIIHVGPAAALIEPVWQNWNEPVEKQIVNKQLEEGKNVIALKNVPNFRLWQERLLSKALNDKSAGTIGDLLHTIDKEDSESLEIKNMIGMAKAKNYHIRLLLHEDPLKINLFMEPAFSGLGVRLPQLKTKGETGIFYTNIPLFSDISVLLQKDLKALLHQRLPEYMVPSELVALNELPLTSNGKIDRRFLSLREGEAVFSKLNYQPPSTAIEKGLAEIWADILSIERVGLNDNFFELGGHSLLAMRVVSAVRKKLNIELLIKDIFAFATVGSLAAHLETRREELLLPAIEALPRPALIPLSFSQERLWFIDRLEGSIQYHIPAVLQLKGKLSLFALQQALQTIVSRHEVLRTIIREEEGQGYQYILAENNFIIDTIDGSAYQHDRQGLLQQVATLVKAPFHLSEDYMLRATLIQVAAEEFVLVVTMHHIASDGWSMSVLVREFVELYRSFTEERPALLAALPIQYADYAIWQRTYLTGDLWNQKIGYWKEKLGGVQPLDLPTDYARPAILSTRGAVSRFKIDQQLSEQLHDLSRRQGVTLFMTLLSAFKVLLYRYSGQQDICVGTPIANRTQKEVEELIGFFVNTLALRSQVDGKAVFTELLQQVKQVMLTAYEHQDVPFERVVDAVIAERDLSRNPLFQAMFVLQNTPDLPEVSLGGIRLSGVASEHTTSKFDLTFALSESADGIYLLVEYCTGLFRPGTIERMAGHYKKLLASVAAAPELQIWKIPMLSVAEENQLLVEFNDTAASYPKDKTIVELFEEQVARTPENIAVVFEEEQLSYDELNVRANQLAHYLRSKGVEEDTLVPVCIERSVEMIVGILGILKAGAAYVPIDPEFPEKRIQYLLEDTAANVVVSSSKYSSKIRSNRQLQIIETDTSAVEIQKQSHENTRIKIESHQVAYIIYTSGSTGTPKGVMVSHSAILNYLFNDQTKYLTDSNNTGSFIHLSYTFDASLTALFMPLLYGKSVVIGSGKSVEVFEDENFRKYAPYDFIKVTPAHLELLQSSIADSNGHLLTKKLVVGGEALHYGQFEYFIEKGLAIEIVNEYGPTEASVGCSTYVFNTVFDQEKIKNGISIGKPIANVEMYIVSADNALLPVGVRGEICISGAGLANGYLNLPQLTADKFVPNPFSKVAGAKMYKTGDLGRWLPDGNIEYLGRIDEQVKVRGYRIELGEIENILLQCKLVAQAVVAIKKDRQSDKLLVAYIVPQGTFNKEEIVNFLKDKLPAYMVPALWIQLESLPLTANGKVDKKALPDAETGNQLTHTYVAPRTDVETALTQIWQQLLGIERVGIQDDFFSLGGHSLLAMRLVSAIRKKLQIELPIKALFRYPTIAALAAHLHTQQETLLLPAVEALPRPALIPLSFSQERLWFIDRLQGSVQYHIPAVLRLTGTLDVAALSHALQQIVNRHEVLRTLILEEEGSGYQHLQPADSWQLQIADGSIYTNDSISLQQYIKSSIQAPFDLSADYLLRAKLISLQAQEHILVATLHHIASDGWSTSIMVTELAELYNAFIEQRPVSLLPLPVQYADYALWQRKYLQGEAWEQKLGYWKDKLNATAPLQLPTDYSRPPIQSSNGAITGLRIDKDLSEALQALSQQQGATLFMTLLASFNVLLYRYSNQQDICVGTPIAGRQQQELEGLIGFFVNTLALRSEVDGSSSFTALLQQVKATTLEAYEHQEIPFEKVVEAVVKERDMSRSPLFQVMLVLQNTPEAGQLHLGQLQLSRGLPGLSANTTSKFDITFNIAETVQGLYLSIEYSTDLYDESTIERMADHFVELLHSVVKAPEQSIAELPMLSSTEEAQLLVGFNDTAASYPKDKTIAELFEEQVARTPEHTAVVFEEEQLTYDELNKRANQLAHYLKSKGVTAETLVPVCIERSVEMIVSILGILKAGGAYVPIDPQYPPDRIGHMLSDTAAQMIICSSSTIGSLPDIMQLDVIVLDECVEELNQQTVDNLAIPIHSRQLAYVIYTSGSTGKPKGAMNEHRGLVNRLLWAQDYFRLTPQDTVLQKTTFSFDVSVWELLWPLLVGARLVFARPEGHRDNDYLKYIIDREKITLLHFVPSMLGTFLPDIEQADCQSLQKVLCSGEALQPWQVNMFREKLPGAGLYNLYGPTEAAIDVTCWPVPDNEKIIYTVPIGKPVANTAIYILDEHKNIVPVGCSGELYISGVQVGRGYLNRNEATSAGFVADRFSAEEGALMYKTGDLGRWLADGNIEYLGRIDDQVKIRGYRIELGEIEAVLQQSGLVTQAVVVARQDNNGDNRLIGYVVSQSPFDRDTIQNYLSERLPEYMVPVLWVQLEALPLTANGKVDKKALPDAETGNQLTHTYVAPRTDVETALTQIWQQLLGIERVGIQDDFFSLGGHSLLAMRLVSAIRKKLQIELPIKALFRYPTIAALAAHLHTQQETLLLPAVEALPRPALIPLSFSQERLWFIDRLQGSVQYHIPAVLRLTGTLDVAALSHALQQIVNRHEVLRTLILEEEGSGYQHLQPADSWQLQIADGSIYTNDSIGLQQYIKSSIQAPFDLSADYLLRAKLVSLQAQEHILVATLHHIASDGWSTSIMVTELAELYNAFIEQRPVSLLPLPVQYADYALWQRKYLQGEAWEQKLGYWKDKLNATAPLQLPTDYSRPPIQSSNGAISGLRIDKDLSEALQALSQQQGATLFMTLLATFNVLLYRYSNQQDICVGTPIAGRQQQELEGLIGFFVNTLALRSEVDGSSSFTALLQQVKATTLEAYEHQEIPFEKVVEAVVKERDMSRSPLFQVMLVLQNTPEAGQLHLGQLQLSRGLPGLSANTTSKFDITFNIAETVQGLYLSIEYSTDLYDESTIERMADHFVELLHSVVKAPEQSIAELPMLSSTEEAQLLVGFNDTAASYPKDKTIAELFEEQVARTPEHTAVVFEEEQLTYDELNKRANQLAHYLRSKGVTAETLVPVCIERSVEMIIGILGILKAGAAYVPIDPDYPVDRINFMLTDIAGTIIVSSKKSKLKLPETYAVDIIELDNKQILQQSLTNLQSIAKPQHLAYIIYTSGSTGKPKGVMIEHSSVANLIYAQTAYFNIGSNERILQFSNYCFDASVEQIFLALFNGAALILFPEGLQYNTDLFEDFLQEKSVSHLHATPSFLENIHPQDCKSLKRVIAGGDVCGEKLSVRWKDKVDFYNEYGPTETTVTAIEYHDNNVETNSVIPIGKPLSNVSVYILDKNEALCPTGIPGELHIGGIQVARGYLNRTALTAEKFITNKFVREAGARLYKTGDLARWLPDGNLSFLGRIDEQVKVRGYRIEIGEIENVVQESGLVSKATVIAKEDNEGTKQLIGYVVADNFNRKELMSYLKTKLPEYMVPALWIQLESLPLTPNGKVDKKALPDAETGNQLTHTYVAPRTDVETALTQIWQQLLGIERVGIQDDFFSLGGHSLLAMRLVSAIRKKLSVEMAIKSLFRYPTIAALAAHLHTQQETLLLPAVEALPRPALIPLSFSQERLWFIDRLQGSVQYHIPAVLRLTGTLDVAALSHALQQIVNRHEVLRTLILEEEGSGYQHLQPADSWQLQIADGSIYTNDSIGLQQYIKSSIQAPFDLSADYLLRAKLVSLQAQEHILVATLHHIASDGWSTSIMVTELAELYNAFIEQRPVSLLPLPVQYADYALWQRKYLQGEAWEQKLGYWKDKLNATAPLQLPTDYSRPPIQSSNGAISGLRIDKDLSEALQALSQQQGATLFMTLLATFNVLLYRYSNQQDICVGTPIAGRQQQELEGLIGFFVNTLALRSEVDGSSSFTALLQQVKATTLEAYEHQEIPFEKVVEAVVKERDMSRSPLFQVMLVLQNTPEVGQLHLGQLQLSRGLPGMSSHTSSKFDLIFYVSETSQGLALTVEYCTDLYGEATVSRMMAHYQKLLHSVVTASGQSIDDLPMLSTAEEKQLLTEFNDTAAVYPKDKTIVELFEEQAARTPERTAVVFEEEQLTYDELNKRANQLAHYLKKKGAVPETLVPLSLERSMETIIAVLAILKVGAAYVPIDPEYPQERISYMLEDMGAALLISTEQNVTRLATAKSYAVINPLEESQLIRKEPTTNLSLSGDADKLVYVLYTSGSTGRPKGVRMANSALVNLVSWQQKQFTNKNNRRILQFASLNFDVSFQEIFSTLCFGSRLYLIAEERRKDMAAMLSDIDKYYITHLFLPYIVLKTLAEYAISLSSSVSSLEEMMIAGEQLKLTDDIRKLLSNSSIKLINQYGPTEAHVVSSYTINTEKDVSALPPIGKPIDNTYLYILGAGHQLVPVGVAGELYIGGVQVARGYLNLPELTAERFMSDPFRKEVADSRMYKTGDLARWLPDGNIEYLGRIDGQVKVRGYRIELGEIEAVLQQSKLVEQAVVVAKEDSSGNKNLIAYVVTAGVFDQESLISYLKAELPAYMVPQVWVQMEHFPLTNSGKIDRQVLPDPGISQLSAKRYEAPRDELETRLVNIWQELLGISQVGIHDNFFDIGGHSLYAIRLVWLIRKKMNINVSVNDVFIYPTVAALAGNIVNKVRNPSLPDLNIKYLVPIKTTGSKPPLYVVAGGGGTSLKIKKFVELLDAGQPVYVFQPPIGDADLKGFPETIEGIATVFIEELLIQNPDGPYALSGHCIGGIVAFEMAKQLQSRGKKVHLLAMFDTIIRRQVEPEPGALKNLYHIPSAIQKSLSRFMLRVNFQTYMLRNHPRQSMLYKVNTFRSIRNRIKRKNFKEDYLKYAGEEIFEDSIEIYVAASKNYKLHPYDGKIILFFATDRYFFLDRNNNIGYKKMQLDEKTKTAWNDYANSTTMYEIKGEHSDIFAPIHGEEFAKTLQKHLDHP